MNHDSDKEIDLLLRRHLRRSASSPAGAADALPGAAGEVYAHMDADELSAYAEGALPASARLRYASHLADCDSCRRIVTELALSSSIQAQESANLVQTVETAPARSWGEWLAAIFSPRALRWAAPALALVAFASVIFIVMRNREVPSFVTQNPPNSQQSADTKVAQREEGATSTGTSAGQSNNQGANTNPNANSGATSANTTSATQPQAVSPAATPSIQADGIGTADSSPSKSTTAPGNQPQPPPAPQENAIEVNKPSQPFIKQPEDKLADRAREKDDGYAAQKRKEGSETVSESASPATAGPTGGRRNRSTDSAGGGGALGASSRAATDEERQQKNEAPKSAPATAARARRDTSGADVDSSAPTRSVAGKRFRQQSGIWVDTAYSSSRSLVKVRRGSEQYRALIADEPVIETISNSLGGAVIVVVRGRAYHIY